MISKIKKYYIQSRLKLIDIDFLSFEEEMISTKDKEIILSLLSNKTNVKNKLPNPHNSIILYLTGITDCFDKNKARSDTIGGSPPDIDIDFDSLDRSKAIDWVVEYWGREKVANIITHGTFKPKSLARSYYRVTEGNTEDLNSILKKIPPPKYGKEATLEEIVVVAPEIKEYKDFYSAAVKLENMVSTFGIHAAGVVISDFPISDIVPIWKNSNADAITQFNKDEVEELGLIKFDFLGIDTLSIIKEAVRLIEKYKNIKINIQDIPDGDKKTYALLKHGLTTGIFQIETSGKAKELVRKIEPESIPEISDVSALNRPGPIAAGMDKQYIANKKNGYPPDDMPDPIASILKDTYWTLVYQEQVMTLCSELAGFTLKEADDIRRAMGKKKKEVLDSYKVQFIEGCCEKNVHEADAKQLWKDLLGFADYCFNKSHSICYSHLTYISAYLKANYPVEFFCALMSTRSKTLQPKLWAQKAPEYIQEAKVLGVEINPPSVNGSNLDFSIRENEIYFGLNAIRDVGKTASECIAKARGNMPYKDIFDFIQRTNLRKVTTKTFVSLVKAGAFDKMGYLREELIENAIMLYDLIKITNASAEREIEAAERKEQNIQKTIEKDRILAEIKEAKKTIKLYKKQNKEVPEDLLNIVDRPNRLKKYRELAKADSLDLLLPQEIEEYEKSIWLRKKPELKSIQIPDAPLLRRQKEIQLTLKDIMEQARYIGCYVGIHPAKLINSGSKEIISLYSGERARVCGVANSVKVIKTKRGYNMCFIELDDSSAIAEIIVFQKLFLKLKTIPGPGDLLVLNVKVEKTEPVIKLIAESIKIYQE